MKSSNPLNKSSFWYVGLAEFGFQVSIVSLGGSMMSEILDTSVHSGWDERRMENANPLKLFQIFKKNLEKSLLSKTPNYYLFVYASARSHNGQGTLL